jgi:lipopolysaccharide transport system permease protein
MDKRQLSLVVWEQSRLNLKSEASKNYLSYAWWGVEPVIHMLCYFFVFELLLDRGGPGFVYFLLVGLVPWIWFSRTISLGSNSLVDGRFIMGQVFIPKLFFPLVILIQSGVKHVFVFILLLTFLTIFDPSPSVHWFAILIVILTQMALMFPLVCLLALSVAFVRDLNVVIPLGLQFMFFCTGIFFDIESVAPQYLDLFFLNPVAGLVHQYREILLNNAWPDWFYLGKVFFTGVVLWILTIILFKRNEHTISRVTQE